MTHLSSTRQNTARTYYNTSIARTHTSSSLWSQHNKDHYPSWTHLLPYNQTTPSALQYTENQHTLTNICIGTAITTSQPNKVFSTPLPTGLKQYLRPRKTWTRNYHILKQPSTTANSLPGHSTNGNISSTIPTRHQLPTTPTLTPIQPTTPTTKPP